MSPQPRGASYHRRCPTEMSHTSPRGFSDVCDINPDEVFRGVILITVPHMDDEALACGGTIARLSDKSRLHLVYATDGLKAPEPVLPWIDSVTPDLGTTRQAEAVAAMQLLGVPSGNIEFLNLPERGLKGFPILRKRIEETLGRVRPDHVLTPFRYDRHRDHIALNRAATLAIANASWPVQLWEYFVYHSWRLLPKRDVRRYIATQHLRRVETAEVGTRKRAALECFKSQTTRFYEWQARPNLTPALLEQVSQEPELFLKCDPGLPGPAVFESSRVWIGIAHRLESPLKRCKDRVFAIFKRLYGSQLNGVKDPQR